MIRYFAILFLVAFFGCKNAEKNTTNNDSNVDVSANIIPSTEIVEIAQGQNSGFTKQTFEVIYTKEQFAQYWDTAYKNYLEKPPLPKIDFENENVLLVAAGTKNTGGYTIYINSDKPNVKGQSILFTVILEKPGKNCIVTEALTSPFRFYSIQKVPGPVGFALQEITKECK
ncbi:MAG TPA: hypothetical protein DIU39_00915 [Flavobacteriales bacterium]|nr:hypothetical protein [Flavobacteriales bacterium]|tara:strand:- start:88783 stop:89295 length:513 start_codon:yes stop_codon:yes gene_type:complete